MNKKQRLQIQQAKQDRTITVQEAWNVISEFMIKESSFTYFVSAWDKNDNHKYTLQIIVNGEMVDVLSSNKEWSNQ